MPKRTVREAVASDAGLRQSRKTSQALKKLLRDSHHPAHHSVRETHYKGHHIVVITRYEVTVDGQRFDADFAVGNSGNVGYHGMPNVGFASAIDLMQSVIDQFPDDFKKSHRTESPHGEHDDSHAARRRGTRARHRPHRA
jgi:hypothetical protein